MYGPSAERPFAFPRAPTVATFFPELINANCMPFYFRLLDTPVQPVRVFPLAFSSLVYTNVHAYHPLYFSTLLFSLLLSFHPSLLPLILSFSLLYLPTWLPTADWVVEACHSRYRPADTPNPPSTLCVSTIFIFLSSSRFLSLPLLYIGPALRRVASFFLHNRQTVRLPDALAHCAFNKELLASLLRENSL